MRVEYSPDGGEIQLGDVTRRGSALLDLLSLGYTGVFLFSLALNMLPFMSPSNVLVAGAAAMALPWSNPFLVGFLVALASSVAKLTHFYGVFFVRRSLSEERRMRLERYGSRMGHVGSALLFVAAMSPIPDETVVIPLGLMRYNPAKFFAVFFAGKVIITILGAFLGSQASLALSDLIGSPSVIVLSVVLTVGVTYLLLRYDLGELTMRVWRRIRG